MGAYKDKNGKWYISVRYKNWLGEGCRKTKRGFTTKRDALEWEREFLARNTGSLDMTFGSFYEVYKNNLQDRIRQNTWVTKSSIIEKKILPYFGSKRMCDPFFCCMGGLLDDSRKPASTQCAERLDRRNIYIYFSSLGLLDSLLYVAGWNHISSC